MCQSDVESEFHVLIDWVFYSDITQDLMECAQDIDLRFNYMCSFDKFCFLMSHEQLQVDSAKACQKILLRRQHMLYISDYCIVLILLI